MTLLDISKELGWSTPAMDLPTIKEVEDLYNSSLQGNLDDFKKLYKLCRFAKRPASREEFERDAYMRNYFVLAREKLFGE